MKYGELEPDIYYEITKASTDKTFQIGTIFRLMKDRSISTLPDRKQIAKGAMKAETCDFEAEVWEWQDGVSQIKDSLSEKDRERKFHGIEEAIRYFSQSATAYLYTCQAKDSRKQGKRKSEASYIPASSKDELQISLWLEELVRLRRDIDELYNFD